MAVTLEARGGIEPPIKVQWIFIYPLTYQWISLRAFTRI